MRNPKSKIQSPKSKQRNQIQNPNGAMRGHIALQNRIQNPNRCPSRPLLPEDESGVTALEYLIAALAIAFGAVLASRAIAGALNDYLHRIYLVVTLPVL